MVGLGGSSGTAVTGQLGSRAFTCLSISASFLFWMYWGHVNLSLYRALRESGLTCDRNNLIWWVRKDNHTCIYTYETKFGIPISQNSDRKCEQCSLRTTANILLSHFWEWNQAGREKGASNQDEPADQKHQISAIFFAFINTLRELHHFSSILFWYKSNK